MDNLFLNFNKGAPIPHIERKFSQFYDLEKFQSVPPHPKDRRGVCFIIGTHPCVHDDVAKAAEFFNGFIDHKISVCAINDATTLLAADYLVTAHPEKLEQFLEPVNYPIEIHTRHKMRRPDALESEYIWELNTGGGSALFAIAVMLAIGHEQVVLCGCPMDGGGGYAVKKHDSTIEDPRFGELSPGHTLVQGWHGQIKRFKDENELSGRVRSMSGFTKEVFGGLE